MQFRPCSSRFTTVELRLEDVGVAVCNEDQGRACRFALHLQHRVGTSGASRLRCDRWADNRDRPLGTRAAVAAALSLG